MNNIINWLGQYEKWSNAEIAFCFIYLWVAGFVFGVTVRSKR